MRAEEHTLSVMLSPSQIHTIYTSARAASALSITSSFFVITSFLWNRLFQTPVNRLMFYATWGNVLANVATMIGGDGISRGPKSSLCICQAFLAQWLLPTNAFWIFCMSINVYLTSSHRYRPAELKELEWRYLILCYVLPFLPAFAFLFVNTNENGHIYGNTPLWCWIRPQWQSIRLAFFYGPVWLTVIITISILLYQGIDINAKRKKIMELSMDNVDNIPDKGHQRCPCEAAVIVPRSLQSPNVAAEALNNEHGNPAASGFPSSSEDAQHFREGGIIDSERGSSRTNLAMTSETPNRIPDSAGLGINYEQPQDESRENMQHHATPVENGTIDFEANDIGIEDLENPNSRNSSLPTSIPLRTYGVSLKRNPTSDFNHNRSRSTSHSLLPSPQTVERHQATFLYMKRASLFFLSLLLTWTPSTINRIHYISSPDKPMFGLSLLAAVVLSLQGFWNLLVYVSTSFDAVKALYAACRVKCCRYPEG
ncbi:G-protein coupled receptor [Histoplasma ohiense]|nr:G-protein coupled receptor [Histoplasma ohiense (nom. inval.)]